jgi:hypothetical protein
VRRPVQKMGSVRRSFFECLGIIPTLGTFLLRGCGRATVRKWDKPGPMGDWQPENPMFAIGINRICKTGQRRMLLNYLGVGLKSTFQA